MKEGKSDMNFNLNALTEKNSFEKFEENIKKSFFGVVYLLLKSQSFSAWAEITFAIIQLLQLMAYCFRPLVK